MADSWTNMQTIPMRGGIDDAMSDSDTVLELADHKKKVNSTSCDYVLLLLLARDQLIEQSPLSLSLYKSPLEIVGR